jgi:hypothetical protein
MGLTFIQNRTKNLQCPYCGFMGAIPKIKVKMALKREEKFIREKIRCVMDADWLKTKEDAMIAFENGFWAERKRFLEIDFPKK